MAKKRAESQRASWLTPKAQDPLMGELETRSKAPEFLSWAQEKRPPCFFIVSIKEQTTNCDFPPSHKRAIRCFANSGTWIDWPLCRDYAEPNSLHQAESSRSLLTDHIPCMPNSLGGGKPSCAHRDGVGMKGGVSSLAIPSRFRKKKMKNA